MPWIAQLSDLHLLARPDEQAAVYDSLVSALADEVLERGEAPCLLAITGDLFDTSTLDPSEAVPAALELFERIQAASGATVPTVVVPGNHDRRSAGFVGPNRETLWQALGELAPGHVHVHGNGRFLTDVVDPAWHGLPLWILPIDSTWLPTGWLSAGGVLRQQDLLHAVSRIGSRNPDWPVLVLLHHHLVPTPLSDFELIESEEYPRVVRWALHRVLPRIVSYLDHAEPTMTALGAGTALSTLHTLGRAVLVLHGHKHHAAARCLDAVHRGEGDVIVASAGSAGVAKAWAPHPERDSARLWPSFNAFDWTDGMLRAETISFGWKGSSQGQRVRHPLLEAERRGSQWLQRPVARHAREPSRLLSNVARWELSPADAHAGRYDCEVFREVRPDPIHGPRRYVEEVLGLDGMRVAFEDSKPSRQALELPLNEQASYRLEGGANRRLAAIADTFGSPYGSVGLLNRYAADLAAVEVEGLNGTGKHAFGSAQDLGTGLERPVPVVRQGETLRLEVPDCPARTLLRIYWPLER